MNRTKRELKVYQFVNGLKLKNDKKNNLRTSKLTKIYHKSDVFNVAYQQRIWIVFRFTLKLNDSAELNKLAGDN